MVANTRLCIVASEQFCNSAAPITVVLAGPVLPIEIEELWDCLVARRHFVPEHVGLPDARTLNSGGQFHTVFAMHTMQEIQLCSARRPITRPQDRF